MLNVHRVSRGGWVALFVLTVGCQRPDQSDGGVERALATITPEQVRAPMRFLAHDLLEGRDTGTRGYDIAALYVASELEALGLEPLGGGDSYFQQVPLRRSQLDVESSSASVTIGSAHHELALGDDIILRPPFATEVSRAEGPVVLAGYGISASELDYDDYENLDVAGAVVLVLSGAPPWFESTERAYFSSVETKADQALQRGATGLLVVSTPTDEARRPWEAMKSTMLRPAMRWIDPATDEASGPGAKLAVSGLISRQTAAMLMSDSGQSLDELFDSLDTEPPPRMALAATLEATSAGAVENLESPNVIARLPGADKADEAVLFSAHLDHVGRGRPVDGDDLYNGAYDNASGVAVLLAVAAAYAETSPTPSRSMVFIALTAEEKGLLGSDYFAHHPTIPIESIVANVNADGALMLHPLRDFVAFGADHSTISDAVSRAAADLDLDVTPDFWPEQVIFVRSDQYSFVRRGIPAVYPFVGNETGNDRVNGRALLDEWMASRYHKPSDDMNQEMDFDAGADYAKLCYLIGHYVSGDDERPTWNEGDFLGERFAR